MIGMAYQFDFRSEIHFATLMIMRMTGQNSPASTLRDRTHAHWRTKQPNRRHLEFVLDRRHLQPDGGDGANHVPAVPAPPGRPAHPGRKQVGALGASER